jgi:hypothetical protein
MSFADTRSSQDAGHPGLSAGSSRDFRVCAHVDAPLAGLWRSAVGTPDWLLPVRGFHHHDGVAYRWHGALEAGSSELFQCWRLSGARHMNGALDL